MFGLGRNTIGWWGNGGGVPVVTEWLLNGNTNGAEKYIGTNDNYDLPVRVNGIEAFRFVAATGGIQYPLGASLGYVLTSDASGNATWQSAGGGTVNQLDDVISQTNTPQPDVLGDRYLIGTAPTGIWIGKANQIAEGTGAGYVYTVPVADDYVYATSTLTTRRFNGTIWQVLPGVAIVQNGNILGAAGARIGTNDANPVWLKYNNTLRVRVDGTDIRTPGSLYLGIPGMTSVATARLHVRGAGATSATYAVKVDDSALAPLFYVRNDGNVGIGIAVPTSRLHVVGGATTLSTTTFEWTPDSGGYTQGWIYGDTTTAWMGFGSDGQLKFTTAETLLDWNVGANSGSLSISATELRLTHNLRVELESSVHIIGLGATSATHALKVDNTGSTLKILYCRDDGKVGIGTDTPLNRFYVVGTSTEGIGVYNGTYTTTLLPNGTSTLTELNTDNIGFQLSSADGYFRLNRTTAGVNLFYINNGTGLALSGIASGTHQILLKNNGQITLPNVPIGNAGLVATEVYKDTAANILANGDYVLGMKA